MENTFQLTIVGKYFSAINKSLSQNQFIYIIKTIKSLSIYRQPQQNFLFIILQLPQMYTRKESENIWLSTRNCGLTNEIKSLTFPPFCGLAFRLSSFSRRPFVGEIINKKIFELFPSLKSFLGSICKHSHCSWCLS